MMHTDRGFGDFSFFFFDTMGKGRQDGSKEGVDNGMRMTANALLATGITISRNNSWSTC